MQRAAPPVTVGLPVHNGVAYLAEAVDSLLDQTFVDFELIISDNASTDGTSELCRQYEQEDARVRYLRTEENRGAAWNFNHVFANSRSRLFKFACHDDVCEPTLLERCYTTLESASPDVVLCHPQAVQIDAHGNVLGAIENRLDLRQQAPHERLKAYVQNAWYANPLFGLVKSRALGGTRLLGRYDSADMVLLAEIALRGQIWQLDDVLFKRRLHSQSSRQANLTSAEVTRWFDPTIRRRRTFRRNRMLGELIRAVGVAPIGLTERLRCLQSLTTGWIPCYGKMMVWELWVAGRPHGGHERV